MYPVFIIFLPGDDGSVLSSCDNVLYGDRVCGRRENELVPQTSYLLHLADIQVYIWNSKLI